MNIKILGRLGVVITVPLAAAFTPSVAWADVSCFCKVTTQSYGDTTPGPQNILGANLLLDLGVVATYNNPVTENKRDSCRNTCSQVAANNANFNNPQYWLNKVSCNAKVAAYSAVGANDKYGRAQTPNHPNLINGLRCCTKPASITCASGAAPDTNGPGTKDCKRVWCTGPAATQPPNNTLIGTWGFTWGNQVIQWENPTSFTPAATYVFGSPQCL